MRFDRKDTREVYAGSFRLSYAYDKSQDIIYFLDIYNLLFRKYKFKLEGADHSLGLVKKIAHHW